MPARLVALDDGVDILLDRAMVVVGRHPQCDARLDSLRVSRHHCCMTIDQGGVLVRDLGSTNGIRINGQRVEFGRLQDGDELAIAHIRFRLASSNPQDATFAGQAGLKNPPGTIPTRRASTSAGASNGHADRNGNGSGNGKGSASVTGSKNGHEAFQAWFNPSKVESNGQGVGLGLGAGSGTGTSPDPEVPPIVPPKADAGSNGPDGEEPEPPSANRNQVLPKVSVTSQLPEENALAAAVRDLLPAGMADRCRIQVIVQMPEVEDDEAPGAEKLEACLPDSPH